MILRTADYQQSFFVRYKTGSAGYYTGMHAHHGPSLYQAFLAILFAENRLSRLNSRLEQIINYIHQMMF